MLIRNTENGMRAEPFCKVQTVCFERLACSFDTDVRVDSSLRRIQRFTSEYSLDADIIARFVFSLLPHKPSYKLALDRTNWKINQCAFYHKIVRIKGQLCYLSASRVMNKENAPELQIIVSFNKPANTQVPYKERLQIESIFKTLKTSGLNIDDTHLTDIDRISKLLALVLIAFA